jgi:hypothetical protein
MELVVSYLLFYLGFVALVTIFAGKRGRNRFAWFLLAIVISPLLAGLFLWAVGPAQRETITTVVTRQRPDGSTIQETTTRLIHPKPKPKSWNSV